MPSVSFVIACRDSLYWVRMLHADSKTWVANYASFLYVFDILSKF